MRQTFKDGKCQQSKQYYIKIYSLSGDVSHKATQPSLLSDY